MKDINEEQFNNDLVLGFQNVSDTPNSYDEFRRIFMNTVDKYAPFKTKKVRHNQQPFMNRTLSKEFMKRSKLKNDYNRNPTLGNKALYNK